MDERNTRKTAILLVLSMLLAGCIGEAEPKAIEGCTDELASNFDAAADQDDDSCVYPDSDGDGIYDFDEVAGCTNPAAYNYDETATDDDDSCEIPWISEYGINWVEHDGGEGCECSDGSDWTFWSRDADPSRVILYFQGGGACWEDQSCDTVGGTFKQTVHDDDPSIGSEIGEQGFDIYTLKQYGIGNFRNADNPIADWSWIYIPYCTGDVHLGSKTGEYSDSTIQHRGHNNSQSAYNFMLENYPDAETILVTGSSAGSIPAPLYGARVAVDYPDSQVMVFNDGSDGLFTNETYDFYDIWNLNDTMLDFPGSNELNFNKMDSGDLIIYTHSVDNSIRFGRFSDSNDETMRFFGALLGNDISLEYRDQVLASEQKVEDSGIELSGYMTGGDGHTILLSDRFFTLETEGVSFLDWFTAWIEGDNVEDVHCTDC